MNINLLSLILPLLLAFIVFFIFLTFYEVLCNLRYG